MNDKILIVDDEVEILNSLKIFMEFHGFEAEVAQSAKEALRLLETQKFTIALLDINMPEMNGIELLQEIKQMDFSVQVIMITAYTSFDKTLKSLQYGAIDYVLKPIEDMNALLELIQESSRRVKRWRKVLKDSVFLKK